VSPGNGAIDVVKGPLSDVIRHLRQTALRQDRGGLTDGQLLECFITQRDEASFEALVRRHEALVLGVCRRVLRHEQDAEDAFQATFLVLAKKATAIGQPELVGNWLYGAAYRAALEAKAARRRLRERQVSSMPEPKAVEETDDWLELRPILDRELNRLPDRYRVPVVLCDLEGRTRRAAARQLGVPEGTLSGRLTTARRLLAKRLARHGLAISAGALAAALSPSAASACVPASLVVPTVQAAALLAAGETAAGVVSTKVAALAEGVLKAMFRTKCKVIAVAVLVVGLVVGGWGVLPTVEGQNPAGGKVGAPAAAPVYLRSGGYDVIGNGHKGTLGITVGEPDGHAKFIYDVSGTVYGDPIVGQYDAETGALNFLRMPQGAPPAAQQFYRGTLKVTVSDTGDGGQIARYSLTGKFYSLGNRHGGGKWLEYSWSAEKVVVLVPPRRDDFRRPIP
jgi:RNA polymerase sigma factor (sigma-70 family)